MIKLSKWAVATVFYFYIPALWACSGEITSCFTPGGACDKEIISKINSAKKNILVQAYSFTSAPIAKALADAKRRGVNVKVILDKGQVSQKYSSATYFKTQSIPLWIDNTVSIAHNKVIIIDNNLTITGYIGNQV